MPRYFFDHHTREETTIDDDGVDLPDASAADRLALESLGQLVIDGASRGLTGQMTVVVRNETGLVSRASADVVVNSF
jgi:hypothetical protein